MSQPEECSENNSGENYNKELKKSLIKSLNFATEAHKKQTRKDVDKTPYINHPIGVAYIISEEADMPNLDLLNACLLHDTVEDTSVEIGDIQMKFGDHISNLVAEVTDDKTLPKQKRKDLQIAQAKTLSPQAKMIMLADKLYNLRDLEKGLPEGWSEERRNEYFKWAFEVYKGLRGISCKLEEKLDALFTNKGLMTNEKQNEGTSDISSWKKHDDLKCLIAAANFAAKKFSSHVAFIGVPYINHVVLVAHVVSEEADIQDTTILCAALLCDVMGMAGVSKEEIVDTFGVKVGNLVAELTIDHSMFMRKRGISLDYEIEIKKQMSRAVSNMSHAAKVITLAAIISNCRLMKTEDLASGFERDYLKWAAELCTLMVGTHPVLEQQLNLIFTNRGIRRF